MSESYNLYYRMKRMCLFPVMIAEWFLIVGMIIAVLHYAEAKKEQENDNK